MWVPNIYFLLVAGLTKALADLKKKFGGSIGIADEIESHANNSFFAQATFTVTAALLLSYDKSYSE